MFKSWVKESRQLKVFREASEALDVYKSDGRKSFAIDQLGKFSILTKQWSLQKSISEAQYGERSKLRLLKSWKNITDSNKELRENILDT